MAIDSLTGFDFDEAAGTMDRKRQEEADGTLFVRFYLRPVVDLLRTEGGLVDKRHPRVAELRRLGVEMKPCEDENAGPGWRNHLVVEPAGRPIYHEVEFITIMRPGDRDSVIDRPVSDDDKRRFASRYTAWKAGEKGDGVVGTPLSELPFVRSDMREELAFYGVRTAEQLVSMAESVAQRFMGIRTLQQRVQRWLEGASGNVAIEKLARAAEEKDARIAALESALAQIQSQMGGAPVPVPEAPAPRRKPARRTRRARQTPKGDTDAVAAP